MNIYHLKLFVRIAATKNIRMAGKELGLSPAVSSAHINKLEESLGVRLLHRTTLKVSLTAEGIDFLPHAEEVMTSIELARASVGSGRLNPQGKLRITAPASFARMHIIPALGGFLKKYPDIKLDMRLSDTIVDIVEGGFDIAIRNSSLNDSSLIARKLADDNRMLVASPEFIEQHGSPSSVGDLDTYNCIGLTGLEHWVFQTPKGRLSYKPKHILCMDNGEAVRDACLAGLGITVCSAWCAHDKLASGQLVQLFEDLPLACETAIWAVYPSARMLAPKVRAFIDYLVEVFGETPYWETQIPAD